MMRPGVEAIAAERGLALATVGGVEASVGERVVAVPVGELGVEAFVGDVVVLVLVGERGVSASRPVASQTIVMIRHGVLIKKIARTPPAARRRACGRSVAAFRTAG